MKSKIPVPARLAKSGFNLALIDLHREWRSKLPAIPENGNVQDWTKKIRVVLSPSEARPSTKTTSRSPAKSARPQRSLPPSSSSSSLQTVKATPRRSPQPWEPRCPIPEQGDVRPSTDDASFKASQSLLHHEKLVLRDEFKGAEDKKETGSKIPLHGDTRGKVLREDCGSDISKRAYVKGTFKTVREMYLEAVILEHERELFFKKMDIKAKDDLINNLRSSLQSASEELDRLRVLQLNEKQVSSTEV